MRSLELRSTTQATLFITCTILAISAFREIAAARVAPALGLVPSRGSNRCKLRIKVALRGQSDWRGASVHGRKLMSRRKGAILSRPCRLWVISGHSAKSTRCPLSPPKADMCGATISYSINSLAMASTPGGMVNPSFLAVFHIDHEIKLSRLFDQ